MTNTKALFSLLPTLGILTFIGLYVYATTLYPGGSQADANSVGFDWSNNYWCNLMSEVAMNGYENPASPIALFGMVILCSSMTLFFFQFANYFEENRIWKMTIKISGALAMLSAVFVFTQYHDYMTTILSVSGVVVIIGIIRALDNSNMAFFKVSGMICMALVGINNLFYYNENLIAYLPVVQKVGFILILSWTVGLNLKICKHSFLCFLVSLCAFLPLNGCSDDDEPSRADQYDLNVSVSPEDSGTVDPSKGTYISGTSVELTAASRGGYQFKEWRGDVVGTDNPIRVRMNSDKSITAVFELTGIFKTYVPDDNFEKELIRLGHDDQLDDYVLKSNLKDIKVLDVSNLEIRDLTGIEDFIALNELYCSGNQLQHLNLENNASLTRLDCVGNQLTSLDISKNTSLAFLGCAQNQLMTLAMSNNKSLTHLECGENELASLDLSNTPDLTFLSCSRNLLTNLDVSKNTSLTVLDCGRNNLSNLEVSNNEMLIDLNCNNNALSDLDVGSNTSLTLLDCGDNELKNLDLSNNPTIKNLRCENNQLTGLDLENSLNIEYVFCDNNELVDLNIGNNPTLYGIWCSGNKLTELNITGCPSLSIIRCNNNSLQVLNVQELASLVLLSCQENELTHLDLSNTPLLEQLECGSNQLTELDTSNNPLLNLLHCEWNQLSSLDTSSNTFLERLVCNNNQLSQLDVSELDLLRRLDCSGNPLNCIQVSQEQMDTQINSQYWIKDDASTWSLDCN